MTLSEEIQAKGFTLNASEKCRDCIRRTFIRGFNGSAEIIKTIEYNSGGAIIEQWDVGEFTYYNLQLNMFIDFEGYYNYIHLEEQFD